MSKNRVVYICKTDLAKFSRGKKSPPGAPESTGQFEDLRKSKLYLYLGSRYSGRRNTLLLKVKVVNPVIHWNSLWRKEKGGGGGGGNK